jgi:hypothetical protein
MDRERPLVVGEPPFSAGEGSAVVVASAPPDLAKGSRARSGLLPRTGSGSGSGGHFWLQASASVLSEREAKASFALSPGSSSAATGASKPAGQQDRGPKRVRVHLAGGNLAQRRELRRTGGQRPQLLGRESLGRGGYQTTGFGVDSPQRRSAGSPSGAAPAISGEPAGCGVAGGTVCDASDFCDVTISAAWDEKAAAAASRNPTSAARNGSRRTPCIANGAGTSLAPNDPFCQAGSPGRRKRGRGDCQSQDRPRTADLPPLPKPNSAQTQTIVSPPKKRSCAERSDRVASLRTAIR